MLGYPATNTAKQRGTAGQSQVDDVIPKKLKVGGWTGPLSRLLSLNAGASFLGDCPLIPPPR